MTEQNTHAIELQTGRLPVPHASLERTEHDAEIQHQGNMGAVGTVFCHASNIALSF